MVRQEKTTRETSQVMKRRPGQILERHDLAEDRLTLWSLAEAVAPPRDTTARYPLMFNGTHCI